MEVYTDGGCKGNPGPGAWAFIIVEGDDTQSGSGFSGETTNNRMELLAVINALEMVEATRPRVRGFPVYTDSQYVQKGISQWISAWERNGWKTAGKKPVKNRDLWQKLKVLSDKLLPQWRWVEGHAGNRFNEECDKLVRQEIDSRFL